MIVFIIKNEVVRLFKHFYQLIDLDKRGTGMSNEAGSAMLG